MEWKIWGNITRGTAKAAVWPVNQIVHMASLDLSKTKLAKITGGSPDVTVYAESAETQGAKPNDLWLVCARYQGAIAEVRKRRAKISC